MVMQQPARHGHIMQTHCQASSLRVCQTSYMTNTAIDPAQSTQPSMGKTLISRIQQLTGIWQDTGCPFPARSSMIRRRQPPSALAGLQQLRTPQQAKCAPGPRALPGEQPAGSAAQRMQQADRSPLHVLHHLQQTCLRSPSNSQHLPLRVGLRSTLCRKEQQLEGLLTSQTRLSSPSGLQQGPLSRLSKPTHPATCQAAQRSRRHRLPPRLRPRSRRLSMQGTPLCIMQQGHPLLLQHMCLGSPLEQEPQQEGPSHTTRHRPHRLQCIPSSLLRSLPLAEGLSTPVEPPNRQAHAAQQLLRQEQLQGPTQQREHGIRPHGLRSPHLSLLAPSALAKGTHGLAASLSTHNMVLR